MNEPWHDVDGSEQEFLSAQGDVLRREKARHAKCPSLELILAAKGESLPGELRAEINEHLANCSSCRALAEDMEAAGLLEPTAQEKARMQARLESVLPRPAGQAHGRSWLRSWALVPVGALAVAALAAGGLVLMRGLQERRNISSRVQAPSAPPVLLAALPLDKPAVPAPADSGLTWRGGTQASSYEAQLASALALYEKDDYAGASTKLERLGKKYPGKFETQFYGGICKLFLNDFSGAAAQIGLAQKAGNAVESAEAEWYLAIARQRIGQTDLAIAELQTLCATASAYKGRACDVLKRFPSSHH